MTETVNSEAQVLEFKARKMNSIISMHTMCYSIYIIMSLHTAL